MPRKKQIKADEPLSVLQPFEPEAISEPINELTEEPINQPIDEPIEGESNRNYMSESLQLAQASMTDLFQAQGQLVGVELADTLFDQLEESFVNHLQKRLEVFVDVLLPEIKDTHTQLKQRAVVRLERRLSAFDRIKQIAATITDECKLLPSVTVVGEFVHWQPESKEND